VPLARPDAIVVQPLITTGCSVGNDILPRLKVEVKRVVAEKRAAKARK